MILFKTWRIVMVSIILLLGGAAFAPAQTSPGGAGVPAGVDLDMSRSELEPVIERYAVDLTTLLSSFIMPQAPIAVVPGLAGQAPAQRPAGGRGGRAAALPFGSNSGDAAWMMSPAFRERLKSFYTEWKSSLERMNFDSLSQEGKADYLMFRRLLERELAQVVEQAGQAAAIEPLVPFAGAILGLSEGQRSRKFLEAVKAAETLEQVSRSVEKSRAGAAAAANVRKEDALRAADVVNGLRSLLSSWFGMYYGYDPEFTWWVLEPYRKLDQALGGYAPFINEKLVPPRPADVRVIIGSPIGRNALITALNDEMIPYTPEELIGIANKEFAWCENEMKKASRELGYGDDWLKALEHVKTLHVRPGEQTQFIRDLEDQALEFLDKNDLITIPPLIREVWGLQMMSPERQLMNPFFSGGQRISISFPTHTMTHEQKLQSMRGNNKHFAHATVFHELIPGHGFQGFTRARYNTHRSLFSTSFAGEGWALYWETILWDLGFDKTPEDRMGALFWRIHRCARIIFSLSFHLGKMTPQECVDMLVNRVGHERDNAEGEVRRSFEGSYGPLYQAAYMLGGLQLRALRRELVDTGKMTNRAFHDAVIRQGSIPIEILRIILTNQKVTRDYKTNWRFYGPIE